MSFGDEKRGKGLSNVHLVLRTQKRWQQSALNEAKACLASCQGGKVALFKCLQRAFCLHPLLGCPAGLAK